MSDLHTSIQRNSLIHISGKLISLALGLVTVAILARYLGTTGYGIYTTAVGFLQLFGILLDFGLTLTTAQMISPANAKVDKILSNIFTMRVISSVIVLGIAPLAVLLFPYPPEVKTGVLIMTLSYFCLLMIQIITTVFQKELQMAKITLAEVVGRGFLTALTIIAAQQQMPISVIFWGISLGNVITLAIAWYYARPFMKVQWAFDWAVWKEVWQRTWPMGVSITFNLMYLRLDIIFLSLFRSLTDVGYYGAAYRVVDILTMLPAAYVGIVLPHITKAFAAKDEAQGKQLLQTVFNTMVIFGVPIVVGVMIIAEQFMVFVAGDEFLAAGKILMILVLATAMIFMTSVFGYAVVALSKQREMMLAYGVTAVVTVAGYAVFIPLYGVWAAAWLTVISEAIIMVWSFVKTYQYTKFIPSFGIFGRVFIASGVMAGVVYVMRDFNIALVLVIAALVYFGLLRMIGGIKPGFIKAMVRG